MPSEDFSALEKEHLKIGCAGHPVTYNSPLQIVLLLPFGDFFEFELAGSGA
jgi:hypothetical protein